MHRVAVIGAHGHGAVHLRNVVRLAQDGRVELAGVVDPRPMSPAEHELLGDIPWTPDVGEALASWRPDVTVICTPIPLHLEHGLHALASGSHLLLEKPPTATIADFRRLLAGVETSGLPVTEGRAAVRAAVERRYTLPANGPSGKVD